jgi:hypothetical protein
MLYNLLLRANAELEVTDKIGAAIKTSVDNAKSGDSVRMMTRVPHNDTIMCSRRGQMTFTFVL